MKLSSVLKGFPSSPDRRKPTSRSRASPTPRRTSSPAISSPPSKEKNTTGSTSSPRPPARRGRGPVRPAPARRPRLPLGPRLRCPRSPGPVRGEFLRPSVATDEGRRHHRDQGQDDDDVHPGIHPQAPRASGRRHRDDQLPGPGRFPGKPSGRRPKRPTSSGCSGPCSTTA